MEKQANSCKRNKITHILIAIFGGEGGVVKEIYLKVSISTYSGASVKKFTNKMILFESGNDVLGETFIDSGNSVLRETFTRPPQKNQ